MHIGDRISNKPNKVGDNIWENYLVHITTEREKTLTEIDAHIKSKHTRGDKLLVDSDHYILHATPKGSAHTSRGQIVETQNYHSSLC